MYLIKVHVHVHQEMAVLQQEFFDLHFQIGDFPRYKVESVDGEAELDVVLPEEPVSFLYQLWRSTANAKIESFEDFKMAQFVFLQQKQSRLLCKVRQYVHSHR